MQLPKITNTNELFSEVDKTNLVQKLIDQLNKDFRLIGTDYHFEENLIPNEIFLHLQNIIEIMLQNKFDDFLNLLYRIDIDENRIKEIIDTSNDVINQISFLILKREWKKVWFNTFY